MKRERVTWLLAAVLVVVALGLGVANHLRADRRAKDVARTLAEQERRNRAPTPGASKTASTSEQVETFPPEELEAPPSQFGNRRATVAFDLDDLVKAVRAGDVAKVRAVGWTPPTLDVATVYALLFQIPSSADPKDRDEIMSKLINLIQKTPGEQAANLLYTAVTQEGLLSRHDWSTTVSVLGQRNHVLARSFLEGVAFGPRVESNQSVYAASCALIAFDSAHYVARVAQAIPSADAGHLSDYIESLRQRAWVHRQDISQALPILKDCYASDSTSWWTRIRIAQAMGYHLTHHEAPSTRTWLMDELRRVVNLPESQNPSAQEQAAFRELLASLESSNPK